MKTETPQAIAFNPNEFLIVPARSFEDLKIGEIFRAPSRILTEAHSAAFQTVSCDNHPVHYDMVWAQKHGHKAPIVHGLQVLALPHRGQPFFRMLLVKCLSLLQRLHVNF
jgi:acyl dehydratase